MPRMMVIADDLTGAADCAASSGARGFRTTVLLHSSEEGEPAGTWPDTDVFAIDANTRCLPSDQAVLITSDLVRLCESRVESECLLFKKIDSTLRGNVASELAGLLRVRRASAANDCRMAILMAPALPSQKRITAGGCLLVGGVRLEETDIWKTEVREPQSDICLLLAEAGLSARVVVTNAVRSGPGSLRHAISEAARGADVVVCDAETDEDLLAIAEAGAGVRELAAWAGSAGLASQILQGMSVVPRVDDSFPSGLSVGPSLFVVGTAASASQEQARQLERALGDTTFHVTPTALLGTRGASQRIAERLQANQDVLLVLSEKESGPAFEPNLLARALCDLMPRCAPFIGGLVVTGGETARAALDACGIRSLRLLGEVENGLPFSVTDTWVRRLPVLTKAGAFGSPDSLLRCRDFLRTLERVPEKAEAKDRLVAFEN